MFSTGVDVDKDQDKENGQIVKAESGELKIGGGDELTYGQEYYILNREEILNKRRMKEMEAKFGDFSARLVKRPKKDFLWGFGTQTFDEKNEGCFR
jgi:hypothetical protein